MFFTFLHVFAVICVVKITQGLSDGDLESKKKIVSLCVLVF